MLLSFFCSCQNKEKGVSSVLEAAELTDSLCLSRRKLLRQSKSVVNKQLTTLFLFLAA